MQVKRAPVSPRHVSAHAPGRGRTTRTASGSVPGTAVPLSRCQSVSVAREQGVRKSSAPVSSGMRSSACRRTNTCYVGHTESTASVAWCLALMHTRRCAPGRGGKAAASTSAPLWPRRPPPRCERTGPADAQPHPPGGGWPPRPPGEPALSCGERAVRKQPTARRERTHGSGTAVCWNSPVGWSPPARRGGWRRPWRRGRAGAGPGGRTRRRRRTLSRGHTAPTRHRPWHPPCASLSSQRAPALWRQSQKCWAP